MKKLTTISLFIFWAIVTALFTAWLLSYQQKNQTIPGGSVGTSTSVKLDIPTSGRITLNMTEIAKHNSPNDCWSLINGKVYNVTKAISSHPGGADEIINFCGQDATTAFITKDGQGRPHSSSANQMLTQYYIGDLNQTITSSVTTSTSQSTTVTHPASSQSSQRRENDDDDD